jgi:hypothetical protein
MYPISWLTEKQSVPEEVLIQSGYFTEYAVSRLQIHYFPSGKQHIICQYFQKLDQHIKHKSYVAVFWQIISDVLTSWLSTGPLSDFQGIVTPNGKKY